MQLFVQDPVPGVALLLGQGDGIQEGRQCAQDPVHEEALGHLFYGVNEPGGFVLLTGEVGTGKTTALYDLLAQLPTEWSLAMLSHSTLSELELLEEIWNANPLLRQYLGSVDNPDLILYRIQPRRVRYMQEWALEYHEIPLEAANQ